jgi:hypothetical protein
MLERRAQGILEEAWPLSRSKKGVRQVTTLGAFALGRKAGDLAMAGSSYIRLWVVAMEDMVAANLAYQRAKREGVGGVMAW